MVLALVSIETWEAVTNVSSDSIPTCGFVLARTADALVWIETAVSSASTLRAIAREASHGISAPGPVETGVAVTVAEVDLTLVTRCPENTVTLVMKLD